MLWGDECPDKGYECSKFTHGFYDAVPDYKTLLDNYGMPYEAWAQTPGRAADAPGDGAALMDAHPFL